MRRSRWTLLALLPVLTALAGCTDIEDAMASVSFLNFLRESPALDPYEAPRMPPANAVPAASPGEVWEPELESSDAALRALGDTLMNPVPETEAVLARGAEVFQTYCAVCHGTGSQGDGPLVGAGKLPFATNLMLPAAVERSDGYLYGIVRVGRGLMPSYRRIPPSDRWAVVHYLRYLQGGGDPIEVSLPGGVQPGMAVPGADTASASPGQE